jgi:AraC-like DNA-binding protein
MRNSSSNRIISTPSSYAREHYLYVQETGSLQSIEPHISRRDSLNSLLFFIVMKGSGTLTYKGRQNTIRTGDCIFINCVEEYSHESSLNEPWELSWVHFYGREAEEIYRHYTEQGGLFLFHPADNSPFLRALSSLFEEQTSKDTFFEQLCHKNLTDIITCCYLESASLQEEKSDSTYEKILSVRSYLDEHFAENLNLEILSTQFFISKFHLAREFKKITGVTVGNYLNSRRINEAKRLLRFTKEPIGSIAVSCGVPDVNYFTKVFTKYESMTPSAYRKKW